MRLFVYSGVFSLGKHLSPAYPGRYCMHEALFTDAYLKGTGVSTLDMAKVGATDSNTEGKGEEVMRRSEGMGVREEGRGSTAF